MFSCQGVTPLRINKLFLKTLICFCFVYRFVVLRRMRVWTCNGKHPCGVCLLWSRHLTEHRPDLIRGQLSENYFNTPNCKLPWILKVVLSWQMMNFWVWPDFVAYRFRDRSHPSNWFARKLWKLNGVSWTLKSQQELNQALTDNCLGIFEGFSPE